MEVSRLEDMTHGWFIGNFEPAAFKSEKFEVCYRTHVAGEKWDTHYHKVGTEINLLVKGHMTILGRELTSGDIFTIFPLEIADPIFLEDCTVLTVKTPSAPDDKYDGLGTPEDLRSFLERKKW